MNLLLFAEARQILSTTGAISDCLPALPDEIFEELGFFGAVEKAPDEDDFYDRLAQWFAGPESSPPRYSFAV